LNPGTISVLGLGIYMQCIFTSNISGLSFIGEQYCVVFLPLLFYNFINGRRIRNFSFLGLIWLVFSNGHTKMALKAVNSSIIKDGIFDFIWTQQPIDSVRADKENLFAFGKEYLPKTTLDGIVQLKQKIPPNSKVLNMTELTPLAYELKFIPALNLPLWYNTEITLFENEKKQLFKLIQDRSFDYIFIQWTHESKDPLYSTLINLLENTYTKTLEFGAPRPDAPIFVFSKTPNVK